MEVSKTDADGQVIGTSYWERVDIGFNDFFRLIQEYAELKDMKKILFILGSLRAKSFNRQVANVAKEIIGERAEVQELDYSDLPLLSQDIEHPELEVVARIRKEVTEADGL